MTPDLVGFSIPFRIDSNHRVASASGAAKLKENIIHILLTSVGERVMRRDYGGGMRDLVHDPNNDVLRALAQHQISKSIGQWEPRVQLREVAVRQEEGTLVAEVHYVIRETGQPDNLIANLELGGT